MTPGQRDADEHRAALSLLAAVADDRRDDVTAMLGRGWHRDRRAVMAWDLARWLAITLRGLGVDDPAGIAREIIAETIAAEARGASP
ncbi:MAG: hypothetical protein ACRDOL_36665 [Streptosporangiaceae bacterium]